MLRCTDSSSCDRVRTHSFSSREDFCDFCCEFSGSKRLLNKAGIAVKILQFVIGVAGHEKNAQIGPALSRDAHELRAANIGHDNISKQQVYFALMLSDECAQGVAGTRC